MSPADILAASRGAKTLPEKAVLLTFDDAYESFYRFVYPALRLYNIPAVLSVVTSWIDNPETSAYKTKRFMSWPQIREVADSGLVTVASHSARLHRLLQANPVGNVEPAPAAFLYFPGKQALRDGARVSRPHPRGSGLEHRRADGEAGRKTRASSPGPTGATTPSASRRRRSSASR